MKVFACIAGISMLTNACVSFHTDRYHWGEYEDLINGSFETTEGTEPEAQIQKLTLHIQESKAKDLKIPPGLYAHLGYMNHLTGDSLGAVAAFDAEKALYPSSAVFINRLLASVKTN